jgi:hypothetical protein
MLPRMAIPKALPSSRAVSFQADATLMNPETETVASRNYYIGIGKEVRYDGVGYNQMKIPEGDPFSVDLIASVTEVRGLYHPFSWTEGGSGNRELHRRGFVTATV